MTNRKKLIFVHQYFAPEPAGSAQQLTDLSAGLAERGFSVQVVTGQPSYSSKTKLPGKESFKGVEVFRVPKIQMSRESSLGRVLSAASFFIAAFFKLLWMDRRSFLVIGSDPPLLPLLGWIFRIFRGQKYALIISDLYPDIAVALGEIKPEGWASRVLEAINRKAYRRADRIVVLGEEMAKRVLTKLAGRDSARGEPRDTDRVVVIHNWADGERFRPLAKSENRFREKHNLHNQLIVLFSGNLGKIYNFNDIIDMSASLNGDSFVKFLFIGDGPLRKMLEKKVRAKGLKNIRFLPYQPEEELPYSLASGDLTLIPLKEESAGLCVPGKLYYALASGSPLLVIASKNSEPARIVEDYDCGWVISPGSVGALTDLFKTIAENPSLLKEKGKKARACFESHFSRERAIRQYESIFACA